MKSQIDLSTLIGKTKSEEQHGVVPIGFGVSSKIYGLWNLETNEMVRDFEFSYIDSQFTDGLAVVRVGEDKVGVIYTDGNFFIEPTDSYEDIKLEGNNIIILKHSYECYDLNVIIQDDGSMESLCGTSLRSVEKLDWNGTGLNAYVVTLRADEDSTGVIRSDGKWIAEPRYQSVRRIGKEFVVAEHANHTYELRYMLVADNADSLTLFYADCVWLNPKGLEPDEKMIKYWAPVGGGGMGYIVAGKFEECMSGYNYYDTGDCMGLILCGINAELETIYSVFKRKVVLEHVKSFYAVKSNFAANFALYVFKTVHGRCGIISNTGDILIDMVAGTFEVQAYKDLHLPYLKIKINDCNGVWSYETKSWIILPQWQRLSGPDAKKFFIVGNPKTVGSFLYRIKWIYQYLDINGKADFEGSYLDATPFDNAGLAKVKTIDGKKKTINTVGGKVTKKEERRIRMFNVEHIIE